ncbi:MAG: hypothetical protein Q9227_000543 [Pyrenula ochraceoflavens]
MGIPMNNLHAPSVPSGPTTLAQAENSRLSGRSLTELISFKDDLEAELRALSSVLDSHHVNMNTSLTTFDGYPRDDIDVAQIRTTRTRIIHLKNDYKELMKNIESGLHEHHASLRLQSPAQPSDAAGSQASEPTERASVVDRSFAKVNSVADASPAAVAGLRAGDEIRGFGLADWTNHENLSKIAQIVQQNEGVSIHRNRRFEVY